MAYEKHTWVNGEIITASKMNNIENGIETVDVNQANFIQMVDEGETPSSQQPGIQIENSTQSVLVPTIADFDELETRVDNLEDIINEIPTEQGINEIKNITAPTESTGTASAAHTQGSYLIYDGKLYQATADIAIGGTLSTTGTGANIAQVPGGAMGEVAGLRGATTDLAEYSGILINDKYIDYQNGSFASLSGINYVEFAVSPGEKINYKYTISTPDLRGLAFYNSLGTFIPPGYQTATNPQVLVVPDGAAIMRATISDVSDIIISSYNKAFALFCTDIENDVNAIGEIVDGENPVEKLIAVSTFTDKPNSGGIAYTWNTNNTKCQISGTRTGATFCAIAGGNNSIPTGFVAGGKYNVVFNPTDTNILFQALYYVNGDNTSSQNFDGDGLLTIPSDITGVVFRLSVHSGATVNENVDRPLIYTIPNVVGLKERTEQLEEAVFGSNTNPLAYIRRDAGLLSLFHTVGCIGDSLASGECTYKESGTTRYIDLYDFSWGQCLARLTGNTYYNFSKGGLTTKTWLESSYATECFDGNHNCDMYFIGLGQNDKNASMPVGTTADINLSDYTQNNDTYCGNYGKIIQKLRELQPKAPIFCFIDPNPPMGDQAYNNVIPDIVELFDNVWIIDLLTYGKELFTDPTGIIGSQARSGHYSALGYQQIAFIIATYVDWIVRNNLSDFSQVEFIGTNYEWTT